MCWLGLAECFDNRQILSECNHNNQQEREGERRAIKYLMVAVVNNSNSGKLVAAVARADGLITHGCFG